MRGRRTVHKRFSVVSALTREYWGATWSSHWVFLKFNLHLHHYTFALTATFSDLIPSLAHKPQNTQIILSFYRNWIKYTYTIKTVFEANLIE